MNIACRKRQSVRWTVLSLCAMLGACLAIGWSYLSSPDKEPAAAIKTSPPDVHCRYNAPCSYPEQVDLRVIVLTYKRPSSLNRSLTSLQGLLLDDDDKAMVEIWVDRDRQDEVDAVTMDTLRDFTWKQGAHRVHVHERRAGLYGQWLTTWRPRDDGATAANERVLYLEDDIDVSPYAYRWLKAAWQEYGDLPDLAAITLQDDYIITASGRRKGVALATPTYDPIYMYRIVGPWGLSPHPRVWAQFQDWYFQVRDDPSFHPYVEEAQLYNSWWKDMEEEGRPESMWIMWFIHFCHQRSLYIAHANLPSLTGHKNSSLVVNRKEDGLHFIGRRVADSDQRLLRRWDDAFVNFPEKIIHIDYDGMYT